MPPDQNQYSVDYLNQIAPNANKPGMNNKFFFMIVGGGLLLAVIVGVMLLSVVGSGGSTSKLQTLAARMETLQKIADSANATIKSGSLRSTNSNLSITLTNATRDIAVPLKNNSVDIKKLDKAIVAKENGSALVAKLEDARLNAVYDQTYAREMTYQLATVVALMKEIYNSTGSKSLKDFLQATDKNLEPIKQQLSSFNAVNA